MDFHGPRGVFALNAVYAQASAIGGGRFQLKGPQVFGHPFDRSSLPIQAEYTIFLGSLLMTIIIEDGLAECERQLSENCIVVTLLKLKDKSYLLV